MSRLLMSCSLLAALSSVAAADRAYAPQQHFAQPPNAPHVNAPPHEDRYEPEPSDLVAVAVDRASVRAALIQVRSSNLNAFRTYQQTGVFPSNTFKGQKLNVWRDEDGHFCAAATIIKMSGNDALVDRVAEQSNFIRLGDVRQGPLMDWILTSGFTQEEIAMIQEPFMPVARQPIRNNEPSRPVIDARLRKAEDARLRAKYTQVEKDLVKFQARSLDLAVDRVMKHQQLAWNLVQTHTLPPA